MLQPYRDQFNAEFRVCETPCFFPKSLIDQLADAGSILTHQLLDNPNYRHLSNQTIPAQYRVPSEDAHPNFMTVDFGLVQAHDGSLQPKLVEMQACPSIFGYQDILVRHYIETYQLQPDLQWLLGGHTNETYWALLRKVILGD